MIEKLGMRLTQSDDFDLDDPFVELELTYHSPGATPIPHYAALSTVSEVGGRLMSQVEVVWRLNLAKSDTSS